MQTVRNRRIGIVGGMGPAAGHYFAQKVTALSPAKRDQEHPTIIHISDPSVPDRTAYINETGRDPVPYISRVIKELEKLDVDVICVPCNTAHAPMIFDRYSRYVRTPILNMVHETVDHIARRYPDVQTIGVLGTTGTLSAGSYELAAMRHELQTVAPRPADQLRIMELIYDIKRRGVSPGDAEQLREIASSMKHVDTYIVACTELSMLTGNFRRHSDLPVVDSLEILAQKALDFNPRPSHRRSHAIA